MLHGRINRLRNYFETYLGQNGFELTNAADLADILGLDFICNDERYHGNIGFMFDDNDLDNRTFTLYVTKAFDDKNKRYFGRRNIVSNVDLKFIEESYELLIKKALDVYNSLTDEELCIQVSMR